MPLDHNSGEVLEGLGTMYRVVPTDKWAVTPLFPQAIVAATKAYRAAEGKFCEDGHMDQFVPQQVLCQEYPLIDTLAIIFCKKVKGSEMFYHYTFKLHPSLIGQMSADGFWDTVAPRMIH